MLWRCWLGGKKGIRPVKIWVVGCWQVSDWSEVQTCIWPSWCHCHSLSLASVKSRLLLLFWYWLTGIVPDKGPLNGCVLAVVYIWGRYWWIAVNTFLLWQFKASFKMGCFTESHWFWLDILSVTTSYYTFHLELNQNWTLVKSLTIDSHCY